MAETKQSGFASFGQEGGKLWKSLNTAGQNLFGGVQNGGNAVTGIFTWTADRAAATASTLFLKPTNWLLNGKYRGPLALGAALVGGGVAAAGMVKKHYADKRDAINASPLITQPPGSPYMNSVSPAEYAAMEARMRDAAAGQPGAFAAAEAEKRAEAASGTPVKG